MKVKSKICRVDKKMEQKLLSKKIQIHHYKIESIKIIKSYLIYFL